MKINKKSILFLFLIAILGCYSYSENKEQVKNTQRANAVVDLKEINKIIYTINNINQYWVGTEKVDKDSLYKAALEGMLKSLKDPYSEYLSEKELKELFEGMDGVYVGVGMSIRKEKGDYMEVISPFIGTPAFKAGIQIGDIITKIDGEDIIDLTATESSLKLKGKENTKVTIEVFRKGLKEPLNITLKRAVIKLDNVEYKMLENNIGYISLLNFGENVANEIQDALLKLKEKGMKKLILDLRTNPGGSLSEAVSISSLFVKEDLIASLKYKDGRKQEYKRDREQIYEGDMIVLINKGSASASEILSGVLKDYKRATLIGEKTYGKGVAQNIIRFNNDKDAIKLTIAEFATPKNHNIHKNGIKPDIYIKLNPLISDKGYSSETKEAKENRQKEIYKLLVEIEGEEKAKKIVKEGDRQLKAAIDFLNGKKVTPDKSEEEKNKNKKTKKDKILEENKKK